MWSSLIDRQQLLQLAQYAKEYGVITTLPNFTKLISGAVVSGKFLQATVGPGVFVTLRLNGSVVKTLPAGSYTISVTDKSAKDNFHLTGKGVNKSTSVAKTGTASWTVKLAKGSYTITSDGHAKLLKQSNDRNRIGGRDNRTHQQSQQPCQTDVKMQNNCYYQQGEYHPRNS